MNVQAVEVNQQKERSRRREKIVSQARDLLNQAEALSSRVAITSEIGIAVSTDEHLQDILLSATRQAKWLLNFDHCSVFLGQGGKENCLVTLHGETPDHRTEDTLAKSDFGPVIRTGEPRLIRGDGKQYGLSEYPTRMIVPVMNGGDIIGTLNFFRHSDISFTNADLRIGFLLALELTTALQNSKQIRYLKRTEKELRRQASELEARNRELDSFSHMIAHDLKTPLASITVKTQLVKSISGAALPERAQQHLDSIDRSVEDMARMVDQLLLLAVAQGNREVPGMVNVRAVIDLVRSRYQECLASERIVLQVGELPIARGHAQWVEEIFANLIGNAIKYMGDETDEREISVVGCPDGNMIRYEVRDTGVGIAAEDQARLFEMFTRLDTIKTDGFGLGLSIVQRLVTSLGGSVGVVSAPGEGSTFWFTLPQA